MERIASFCVDHTLLTEGMYLSRIDGDVVTYDIRCCKPNGGQYLENDGMHTVEHLFATYVRNSTYGDRVIYFGPMGCRTGFYFLVRNLTHCDAIRLVQEAFAFILQYTGEIPGVSEAECGNYQEHSLEKARLYSAKMIQVLKNWTKEQLTYRTK